MSPTATTKKPADERVYEVGELTRVEGEGSLRLRVRDGEVIEARLGIFETPRYFEALVCGRTPNEVIDMVARICGICPVAYQMSAVHGFEELFGIRIDPASRALRRLLYCGEWIESHTLHIYLLHLPDFLGYESGIAMVADHRPVVEAALRAKKAGNEVIKALGGRPIHPVGVRVGGWSRAPRKSELTALLPELTYGLKVAQDTLKLVSGLQMPPFFREPRLVSIKHPHEYPYNEGRIVSNDGINIPLGAWRTMFEEFQVEGTNALHARAKDGKGVYLLGPAARVTLTPETLHPLAREALAATGMAELIRTNIYASIVARAVELIHAFAEAIDIIEAYTPPQESLVPWTSRPGTAAWATEAPRGMLFHQYEIDEAGRIKHAQIVPPTSQNQAAIEADLRVAAREVLDLEHGAATHRLEQMIRSYDPCISCATHFLDLSIEEV
jgi:coenzyme F420-reducing hydrogenase alpha subunit